MIEARQEKRIAILGTKRTSNETSWENMLDFISLIGCEVEDDPDIHPTGRLLVLVKLCTVNRKQDDSIARRYLSSLDSTEVVTPTGEVVIDVQGVVDTKFLQNTVSFLFTILHGLSAHRIAPCCLELWTEW